MAMGTLRVESLDPDKSNLLSADQHTCSRQSATVQPLRVGIYLVDCLNMAPQHCNIPAASPAHSTPQCTTTVALLRLTCQSINGGEWYLLASRSVPYILYYIYTIGTYLPVDPSQSLIALSNDADATNLPSGEKQT